MPIPKEKEAYSRMTARERIYNTLRQWIIDGTLQPNERLNDMELAEYFSVSRTPVREALQLLSEQKLLQIVPSSGTYVAPIDLQDITYVYQLLGELQALALMFCIDRITSADLSHLTALNNDFLRNASHGSASDANRIDCEFHSYLAELTGNPYLISFTDQLTLQACRNENQYFKNSSRRHESYESHNRIIDALCRKDLSAAQQEIRKNWNTPIYYET